jgi:hypothetical protein
LSVGTLSTLPITTTSTGALRDSLAQTLQSSPVLQFVQAVWQRTFANAIPVEDGLMA